MEFDVGNRIKLFRERKGFTVNKLANLCGISQSYLRDVELNNKNPTVDMLSLICETLEISLKDFFDSSETSAFKDDPIWATIYKLDSKQRSLLKDFLDSIT